MHIQNITFRGSFHRITDCPKPELPEYAFIGRSNVGKSSLINMLTGRKDLAHVSGKPGRTQSLNFFEVESEWMLVDLPGYGYALTSQKQRKSWTKMIMDYLSFRESLVTAFVLIDANVPPQKNDLEFIAQLGEHGIPFNLAFTKVDKSKPHKIDQNIKDFEEVMLESWEELPQSFRSSSNTKAGRKEILKFISTINEQLKNAQL